MSGTNQLVLLSGQFLSSYPDQRIINNPEQSVFSLFSGFPLLASSLYTPPVRARLLECLRGIARSCAVHCFVSRRGNWFRVLSAVLLPFRVSAARMPHRRLGRCEAGRARQPAHRERERVRIQGPARVPCTVLASRVGVSRSLSSSPHSQSRALRHTV